MTKILPLLLIFLLIGCGARKAQVTKLETKTSTELAETTKTNIETTTLKETVIIQDNEDITLTPVDNLKPIEIVKPDGTKTTVYNAKIEHKKGKTTSNTIEQAKQSVKQEKDVKAKVNETTQLKEKQTDRKEGYTFWIFLILILVIYAAWRYFK